MSLLLLQVHAFATLFMVGLIWFVQVVHYPMFRLVGERRFAQYERVHQRRTTWVVAPCMMVEAITAGLLIWFRPASVPASWVAAGLLLLLIIWLVTAGCSVPAHGELSKGFSDRAHRKLVWTNWFRTGAWTIRGLLVCAMFASH